MQEQASDPQLPPRARILRGSLIALALAALVTVLIVLPAEYGRDPLGFGRLTGLLELSRPTRPRNNPTDAAHSDESAVHRSYDKAFRSERLQITLAADEEVEYKATLEAGDHLLYSWRSLQGQVYFDFHGEPLDGPRNAAQSYRIGDGVKASNGALVAPFTGRHGWYWLNLEGHPITIEIELAGYYASFARLTEE